MPLYEMTDQHFRALNQTSFATLGIQERGDLQQSGVFPAQAGMNRTLYVLTHQIGAVVIL